MEYSSPLAAPFLHVSGADDDLHQHRLEANLENWSVRPWLLESQVATKRKLLCPDDWSCREEYFSSLGWLLLNESRYLFASQVKSTDAGSAIWPLMDLLNHTYWLLHMVNEDSSLQEMLEHLWHLWYLARSKPAGEADKLLSACLWQTWWLYMEAWVGGNMLFWGWLSSRRMGEYNAAECTLTTCEVVYI